MKEFLIANWASILIVAVIAGYELFLVANRRWEQLRSTAYKLILEAEKVITGMKRGQDRFKYVMDRLYLLVPTRLQFFVQKICSKKSYRNGSLSLKIILIMG